MNKKDFYGVRLNNYFSPSICSNQKMYFGTLDNIRAFTESLGKGEHSYTIRNAFERYLSGEAEATHEVAYIQQKLIENIELIAEGEVKLGQSAWEFLNVWYHPQYMEMDSAVVKMALIKYEERYLRAIKASVRGLRTCVDINRLKEEWIELSEGFWGHPGVLSSTKDGETYIVYSNLYMKEKEYATKEEALAKFYTDELCLDCFCEDVFGNG
ncbi:MAG: hypothetical protein E7609_03870 [Ruminococcaceae bacterium]|nr:hypothetical protein [Oscillospiraceae bacterium]